jgi:hypothetical protein
MNTAISLRDSIRKNGGRCLHMRYLDRPCRCRCSQLVLEDIPEPHRRAKPGYLRRACDYVHLNSLQAKLLPSEERLEKWRWSSYPAYLRPARRRPRWLRVEQLLGEHGVQRDDAWGHRHLGESMEARRLDVARGDLEVATALRRGWRFGVKARSWWRLWTAVLPKLRSLTLACTILGATVNTSYGQAPTSPPPELERFAWMIGEWHTAATYRFAPEAPPSNTRSTETVRWALNKQFLVSEQEGLMPNGWHTKLIITAWNENVRSYKMIDVDLTGAVTELSMTVDGDIRTIVYYPTLGGHRIRTELKVFHVSDVEYTTRGECSDRDKTWICYEAVSKKGRRM